MVPEGRLRPSFLPGEDLAAYITVWETQADTELAALTLSAAQQAKARTAYVYWRGYLAAAEAMLSEAQSVTVDEYRREFAEEQYNYFLAQANLYQDEFDDLTEEPPAKKKRTTGTVGVRTHALW